MTLDQLIDRLLEQKEAHGGDIPVYDDRDYEPSDLEFNTDDGPAVVISWGDSGL